MSDFNKILLRKNSLRKQCNELRISDIEKAILDLQNILEERKEHEIKLAEDEKERLAKIEEINHAILEAGLSLADFSTLTDNLPKKEVKSKYVIVDNNGNRHEWSGRGKTPLVFAEYMQAHNISKNQLPTLDN